VPSTGESYQVPATTDTTTRGIAGKYVNVYPQRRPLYLQDILGECVGFGGDADEVTGYLNKSFNLGNAVNKNYGWEAAVSDTSSFVDAVGKWLGPTNSVGGNGAFSPTGPFPQGGALPFSPLFDVLGGGNGGFGGWTSNYGDLSGNGTHYDGPGDVCSQTPEEYITNFFSDFSGYTFMQLVDHGTFNYNSSGVWGTAILKLAYNQKFGTSLDYLEILRTELLRPIGISDSDATYFFDNASDPRLSRVPTTWTPPTANVPPLQGSPDGYIRHYYADFATNENTGVSTLLAGFLGYVGVNAAQQANITVNPYNFRCYTDDGKGNLYMGMDGLFTTMGAFNRILSLIKHEGAYYDTSGVLKRLIQAQHMQIVTTPVIDNLLETIAPACPILLSAGAVSPAINPTTGLF
jgi:hypothetical protein